jgi:hypothetical protein
MALHERMTARPDPLARGNGKESKAKEWYGRTTGWFVDWLQSTHMETKRRWRLSTHGRLGGGVLYTQLQLH